MEHDEIASSTDITSTVRDWLIGTRIDEELERDPEPDMDRWYRDSD